MKKLLFLFCTLLMAVSGAWAASYSITFDHRTGTFYKGGSVSTGWVNQWVSNESGKPAVTITASANNINSANGRMAPGSATTCTYTLSVEAGYVITGFSMNCPTSDAAVTVTPTGESATIVSTGGTLEVNSSASSFVYSGSNSGRIKASAGDGGSFIIMVEDIVTVAYCPDYTTSGCSHGLPSTRGSFSGQTYTTSAASGLEGVTITASSGLTIGEQTVNVTNYGKCFKFVTAAASTDYTVTMTVPEGNVITGYYLACSANSNDRRHTLTSADGNVQVEVSSPPYHSPNGPKPFEVTGLNSQSTHFTIRTANAGNTLYIPIFQIYVAKASEVVTDTYKVMFNGTQVASNTVNRILGSTTPILPNSLRKPICSYEYYSDESCTIPLSTLPSTSTNIYVKCVMPSFTLSTSFADATWYYATLRGKYLRADDSAKDGSGRYATNATNEHTDAYKWAFFGNPYSGLYIMNKAQGDGKYLYKPDAQFVFQTLADPTAQNNSLFEATPNGDDGFTLRCLTGATMYINDSGNNGNLGFWNHTAAANDAGSKWVVEEVPDVTIDVTYELWVGGVKVNTVLVEQVAQNSDVAVPASLTSAYSTLAYDFATFGTIGDTDCTITVTATLKDGVVTDLANLSNNKAYTLTTERGVLGTNGTQMVSSFGTAYTASNFAIISYEDNYYLYSVADSKWVGNPTTINSVGNQPALTEDLSAVTALVFDAANATAARPLFYMGMGTNGVNVSNYATGIVVNSWTTRDAGNQYCIIESADFDPADALAALEEHFHPAAEAIFNTAIAQLENINWGTGLNQYSFTGDYAGYTSQANTIISGLKTAGYNDERLSIAQALLANYTLNLPSAGFYRIKGKTNSKYLAAGFASNNKYNMSTATDATTIFYYDGTILTNLYSGMCNGVTASSWAWVTETNASTVIFEDGETNGGYLIHTADAYLFDGGTSADRGNGYDSRLQYRSWYLEEVTTLPVTVSTAKFATLYAPVALTVPSGVAAYAAEDHDTYLKLIDVGSVIPANTGVILYANIAEATTYNFEITTTANTVDDNVLTGTVAAIARPDNSYILSKDKTSGEVGFFKDGASTIPGFKAYQQASGSSLVKSFVFDTETAVKAIEAAQNPSKVVYDLNGRRVENPVKGLYIVNGKKIFVK